MYDPDSFPWLEKEKKMKDRYVINVWKLELEKRKTTMTREIKLSRRMCDVATEMIEEWELGTLAGLQLFLHQKNTS